MEISALLDVDEKELLEACDYARSMSKSRKLVVERMLHGEEWYGTYALADGKVSLLGLCAMYAEPGYPKFCYSITSTLSNHVEDFCREINPAIEKVLQAVGCREGYAWTQAMLDEDGHFYILEMGYRLDGDMMYVPFKDLLGFDVTAWIVDYALGEHNDPGLLPPSQEKAFTRAATSYMLWCNEKGGTIGAIEGLYGEAVSVRAEALLSEGMYDQLGSDLHNERYAAFFDSFGFNVSQ